MDLVLEVKPTQVTLVPDADDAITSDAGWEQALNARVWALGPHHAQAPLLVGRVGCLLESYRRGHGRGCGLRAMHRICALVRGAKPNLSTGVSAAAATSPLSEYVSALARCARGVAAASTGNAGASVCTRLRRLGRAVASPGAHATPFGRPRAV